MLFSIDGITQFSNDILAIKLVHPHHASFISPYQQHITIVHKLDISSLDDKPSVAEKTCLILQNLLTFLPEQELNFQTIE